MHSIWLYVVLLTGVQLSTQAYKDDICKTTEKCNCINVISSGTLEFQCPPYSSEENKTIIHVYSSSKKMRIDCDKIEILDDTFMPDANLDFVKKLEIHECPLPPNGFRDIIQKFSIKKLEFLRFADHPVNKPLTNEDLRGLENVGIIEFKKNNLQTIDGDIFQNTPNLYDLMIDQNELKLNEKMFVKTPNLLVLNINNNKIDHIPKGVFKNLTKLEKLSLWKNNLKFLEEGVFEGLRSLKMLEISLNNIEEIQDTVFNHTKNLKQLSLRRNKLKNISRRIFDDCLQIELINVGENHGVILIDNVFSNFTSLKIVNLENNDLQNISESIFHGSINLQKITLNNNNLKIIPEKLFQHLKGLKQLHLGWNQIETLLPETFSYLENLEILHLQHNQLKKVDNELLENMKNLKEINLSYNKIKRLSTMFISRNKNLVRFLMSYNQFDFEKPSMFSYNTPFSSFSSTNLVEVDLSYNNITRYPYDLNKIATIENINLQHNYIEEIHINLLSTSNSKPVSVDLQCNNISTIHFPTEHLNYSDQYHVDIEISNNPIICDCNSFELARYLRENDHPIRDYLVLKEHLMQCAGPMKLLGQSLAKVALEELICNLDKNCTSNDCDCVFRPVDETLVVDCSKKNLMEVPEIGDLSVYRDFKEIEVHLEDNLLERCPSEFDGYQKTSSWYLKGNAIKNITWIPESLKILDLSKNHLETVDSKVIKLLNESNLDHLYLGKNPWRCDCDIKDFLTYMKDHINQIDISDTRCNITGTRMVDLNTLDVCPNGGTELILVITVVVLFCFFLITSTISVYMLHKNSILIWLYGRGYCLWLVKEEELDKGKIYDAFISFSHKDEDFVAENLVAVLESGNDPYKLCIHFRDWIPGEMIQTQIISSVNDSRRTIVLLSANFLESVWGIVEFKTAHNEAMREGRARVILIIYGDINMEALDDDLKAYLNTNTYIKWGDPWFWDKLKYALPKRRGRKVLSNKHANMMQYIEDKFKLMDKQPTPNVSTPVTKNLDSDPFARII